MPTIAERVQDVWNTVRAGDAVSKARFKIEQEHADRDLGSPFEAKQYYLQVMINEMFLRHGREWFANYDPMVFAVGSYIYDKKYEAVPYVVGPAMLKEFGSETEVPYGMIFENIPVSGFHPYQGGQLTLTIILSKLQRSNNAERLLQVVEGISNSIDPTAAFSTYLKLAGTVLDGVEAILGLKQTEALIGFRTSINPDREGEVLEPAYYVLVDAAEAEVERDRFWVKESRLCIGDSLESAGPYSKNRSVNDFVLFSIAQGKRRRDERILPFFPTWETALDLASRPEMHYWKDAKAQFNTLKRSLITSPDLTKPDSTRLRNEYLEELKQVRRDAVMEGELSESIMPEEELELGRISDELDELDQL